MRGKSMSISSGRAGGRRHNVVAEYREGLANVDPERTPENAVLVDRRIEGVYRERFGAAVDAYNESQRAKGHPERAIADYLAKVRGSKQQKASYELVIQVGDRLTNPATDPRCRRESAEIYREFFSRWKEAFPHFDVVTAAVHVDEATPHLHVEYVPWADGQRRGPAVKNSHGQAIRQMGYADVAELNASMFGILEDVARGHGIERVDMGLKGREHLDVRAFKEMCREAERNGYPYQNDPRLVELLEEQQRSLIIANDTIEDQFAALGEVRAMAETPVSAARNAARIRDAADGAMERSRPVVTTLQRLCEAVRDALAGVPTNWRDHLIHPVSEALKSARERLAEWARRQNESVSHGNDGLAESLGRVDRAVAEREDRDRGRGIGGRDR